MAQVLIMIIIREIKPMASCVLSECGEVDARPAVQHDEADGQGGEVQVQSDPEGCPPRQVQRGHGEDRGGRSRVGTPAE